MFTGAIIQCNIQTSSSMTTAVAYHTVSNLLFLATSHTKAALVHCHFCLWHDSVPLL